MYQVLITYLYLNSNGSSAIYWFDSLSRNIESITLVQVNFLKNKNANSGPTY